MHSGVEPDSVSATIASTSMWFAVNITACAMAWANSVTRPSMRSRPGSRASWYFSAPSITSAMASTARLGVLAHGRLSRQHHRVAAVEHGVGHVGDLGARRHRAVDHRLHHLRRGDRHAVEAARHVQDLLLQPGELRVADLDAEVAARDHHRVAGLDDLLEARDRFAALDLGDDAGVAARRPEQRPRFLDVRRPGERTTPRGSPRRATPPAARPPGPCP